MNKNNNINALGDFDDLPSRRLAARRIELPSPPAAVGSYEPWSRYGDLVTTSFQLPFENGRLRFAGRLGETLTALEGIAAARLCALNGLAQLVQAAGSINRIRLIRLDGHVGCVPGFDAMPQVLDAASDLLHEVLARRGLHARTALGHQVMPLDAPVMLGFFAQILDDEGSSV